jgi:TalC/MipB family fructose-6-phosphate aldolase
MEFLLDWAILDDIRKCNEIWPLSGVTSNPSILKKAGKVDFFEHFREIRRLIGREKSLHIQVTGADAPAMCREAETILDKIDPDVYIKIPVDPEGLKAVKILKARGVKITATVIYTKIQGFLAMEAGADYLAPYYNRMETENMDPDGVISALAEQIKRGGYGTKILAASFHRIGQVYAAAAMGAQAFTLQPALYSEALAIPVVEAAVSDFGRDWEALFGKKTIDEL